jgi:hypothetical protein
MSCGKGSNSIRGFELTLSDLATEGHSEPLAVHSIGHRARAAHFELGASHAADEPPPAAAQEGLIGAIAA